MHFDRKVFCLFVSTQGKPGHALKQYFDALNSARIEESVQSLRPARYSRLLAETRQFREELRQQRRDDNTSSSAAAAESDVKPTGRR
jgi:hypothetical protein